MIWNRFSEMEGCDKRYEVHDEDETKRLVFSMISLFCERGYQEEIDHTFRSKGI